MRTPLLVMVLMISLAPLSVEATSGRAMTVAVELDERIWLSSEEVEVDIYVSGAPYNRDLLLEWTLSDEFGELSSGNMTFQMSGSTHVIPMEFSKFHRGSYLVELDVTVSFDSTTQSDKGEFIVFSDSIQTPGINNFLMFGDSLSDMGNGHDSWLNVPDVPPYWQGRFSNGPVWLEHLSDDWGINTTHGSGTAAGDNRAFGGAQLGAGYAYLVIPNVGTQINNYLANVQSNISSDEMVILWAGGNNFLYGTGNPDEMSQYMAAHVRTLAAAGASNFVVINLPPIDQTPEGRSKSASAQATMAQNVVAYNQKLEVEMNNLTSSMGLDITLVDSYDIFLKVVNNSAHAGITNVVDPACSGSGGLLPLPICSNGDPIAANVDEYLFFDKAHPTRVMHELIGAYAIESIGANDTDGDGVADEYDICDWTEDASTVNVDGCDWNQQDEDDDGVANGMDDCLETEPGHEVDSNGCAAYQRDSDEDGLTDDIDPCPNDVPGNDHDSDGCIDLVDEDDDDDGLLDEDDECPLGMIGIHDADFDGDGCHDQEDEDDDNDGLSDSQEDSVGSNPFDEDSDDDGVWDGQDAFPIDPSEWVDTDGDGVGGNSDAFPHDPSEWADADYDDVGDNSDAFPNDPTEWDDSDSDGFGDNSDQCPSEFGTSIFPKGCPDQDGDGFSDENDLFPTDPTDWADGDEDGVGDNNDQFPEDPTEWVDTDMDGVGDNADVFPFDDTEWADSDLDGCGDNSDQVPLDPRDCFDRDNDGVGDSTDPWPDNPNEWQDSDYDGVGDNSDFAPHDASEQFDSDGDGVGDNADPWPKDASRSRDSDGDGVADSEDAFPDNPQVASLWSLTFGLVAICAVAAVAIFVLKRSRAPQVAKDDVWGPGAPLEAPSFDDWD